MPTFAYEAVDSKGKESKGVIEAATSDEAVAKIRKMGLLPMQVKAKGGGGSGGATGSKKSSVVATAPEAAKKRGFSLASLQGVSRKELTLFTSQLSTLQDAGLQIVRSLKILEGQLKGGALKGIVKDVGESVESGSTLSESMAKHPRVFDHLYISMVRAGEAGGILEVILQRLSQFMEKSQRLRRKIKGAMVYPTMLVTVATLIMAVIMVVVVPKFDEIFKELKTDLPTPTLILFGLCNVIKKLWFLIPLIPVTIITAVKMLGMNPTGRFYIDRLKLSAPLFGVIIRKATIARLARTLGTLVQSGVPILEALNITRDTAGNACVAKAVGDVHDSIREGDTIAEPLSRSGIFDDIVVNMIDVGEQTGELDKMLIKIADNYDYEVDTAVEAMMSALEPLMILVMGAVVGSIVICLFMPLVNIITTLGEQSDKGARSGIK
ncbi:MAG: type II secretion system F family protein [Planctomycetota bacterium]